MFQGGLELMLYVRDVTRSIQFYRDLLGFNVDGWWDDAAGGYVTEPKEGEVLHYCALRAGEQKVALHLAEPGQTVGGGAFYHLRVAEVDAFHQKVSAAGAKASAPADMPWGWRQTNVQDPDGHCWGFFTPIHG